MAYAIVVQMLWRTVVTIFTFHHRVLCLCVAFSLSLCIGCVSDAPRLSNINDEFDTGLSDVSVRNFMGQMEPDSATRRGPDRGAADEPIIDQNIVQGGAPDVGMQQSDGAPMSPGADVDLGLGQNRQPTIDAATAVGSNDAQLNAEPDAQRELDMSASMDMDRRPPADANVSPPSRVNCRRDSCECEVDNCGLLCERQRCSTRCASDVENCNSVCRANDCQQTCSDNASCSGRCEANRCQFDCQDESSCDYQCFSPTCNFVCGDDAQCNFNCEGQRCDIDCSEADRCDVRCRADLCVVRCGDLDRDECNLDCEGRECRRIFDD